MKHREWLGNKELIEKLLKKSGLYYPEKSKLKIAMKSIIWSRYVDLLSVEDTMSRLLFEHGIDYSYRTYFRVFEKAIAILEKVAEN